MGTLLIFMLWIGCGIGIEGLIKRVKQQKRRHMRQKRTIKGRVCQTRRQETEHFWDYQISA